MFDDVYMSCSHLMGAFTPNSPLVRRHQLMNGYQLRDRQDRHGRSSQRDHPFTSEKSPNRRLIMFTSTHHGSVLTTTLKVHGKVSKQLCRATPKLPLGHGKLIITNTRRLKAEVTRRRSFN